MLKKRMKGVLGPEKILNPPPKKIKNLVGPDRQA
jgi:hypothetical protein